MYDIIGDIHGQAGKLEALLTNMGYQLKDGVYQHPQRTLISVGDLIDRGPQQRRSVDIIRAMVEHGSALCVMGNHEFNAMAWASKDENGEFLRPHTDKNFDQHKAFLQEAERDTQWYADTLEWFKTLPMYLDLSDLRVVHACWHEPSLAVLADYATDGVLHEDAWVAANTKGHELFTAVEVLCKGWEVRLPDGYAFLDKSGHPRTEIRTRWWHQQNPHYRELAIGVDDINKLPDAEIPGQAMPGYDNQKPLFIGHYWMHGTPCVQTDHIACVDWSAGKEGPLVGYRLNGNPLRNTQFFTS
ncbi:metallophosphoesterase [Idiomarina sp.]|uniref:metallophosphoesterase n=1 Tax=Idiomarina sp. TaxID=1874361 RepID=UPI0025C5383F|nr:metallophosphoesterase [Idiomarina sp.]